MSEAQDERAVQKAREKRAFAKAYEKAFTEEMLSGNHKITGIMTQDIRTIIDSNPDPVKKVEHLRRRLKGTTLGERVEVRAILETDLGVSESMQESAMKRQKKLVSMTAAQSASIGEKQQLKHVHIPVETPQEKEYRETHPTGTYKEFDVQPGAAIKNPFFFELKKKKKGGKKSHKKGGKKSHKKGGKKSHKRRH